MHILVIEDDSEAAAYLVKGLTESGHRVDLAEHGRTGLDIARRENFDAMIIDRMLPGLDGLSIIAALRAAKNQTPVLVLSALGDVEPGAAVIGQIHAMAALGQPFDEISGSLTVVLNDQDMHGIDSPKRVEGGRQPPSLPITHSRDCSATGRRID